jgi:TRAP-type C4-dicarboxylate transport system permease small subunit
MSVTEPDKTASQHATSPRLKVVLERLSAWFNWIAVGALLLMFAVLVLDILSSKILNRPFVATVDVASLLALVVASFSVSRTILAGRHIEVDFIVSRLPQGVRKISNSVASLLSLGFFVLIVWRSFLYGRSLQVTGESSLTTHIPMAPFAYGIAIACIPAVLIYLYRTYRDMKEVR